MMIQQNTFFEKYNISQEKYTETGLVWEDLVNIFEDYGDFRKSLEEPAVYIFNTLMKMPNVHSVRYRVKDSEHLIEKIIRKKIEKPDSDNVTLENYKEKITDLIGLRALHLFKENWTEIHDGIEKKWNFKEDENPTANYRDGDSIAMLNLYEQKGCEVKKHKYGYRSVHYIIETKPDKVTYYAEIQVRTIFEEAWAEIDHTIRYPYDLDNQIFTQFLLILNRLSGSADEMGSFINLLKNEMELKKEQLSEKDLIISELERKIENLNLSVEQLKSVQEDLEKLRRQRVPLFSIDFQDGLLKNISSSSSFDLSKKPFRPLIFPEGIQQIA
jgi:putative GTP pyrophosphokinase